MFLVGERNTNTNKGEQVNKNIPSATFTIDNHFADTISVATGHGTYSNEDSVEIAFFRDGKWVTTTMVEFAGYADPIAGDTRVYGWVPTYLVDAFLANYNAQEKSNV